MHHHKYGDKTSDDVRRTLLALTLDFVREARTLAGMTRIAMLGSLLGSKLYPKDADLLVTITSEVDFNRLAALARRLKGRAQAINSGADVFLADDSPQYLGRICHYRECFPRRACRARNCGAIQHLNDDLDILTLRPELVNHPPLLLHPRVEASIPIPPDVTEQLIGPLERGLARGR